MFLPIKAIPLVEKVLVGEKGRHKMEHEKHRLHILISCCRNKQVCFTFFSTSVHKFPKKKLRLNLSMLSTLYVATLLHYSITFHCCLLIYHSKLHLRFGNFWALRIIQSSKIKKLKRKV